MTRTHAASHSDELVADERRGGGASGDADRAAVAARLGRPPQGAFEVVVRAPDGAPVVIRNEPLLDDGTPMPTRYWLVDPDVRAAIGRLEAAGGVRRAEVEVDPVALAVAHERYAAERDGALAAGHAGARPSGGVGGTRTGVKCLHAHFAWYLAGGDDPVGRWVAEHLPRDLAAAFSTATPPHPPSAAARRRICADSVPSGGPVDNGDRR